MQFIFRMNLSVITTLWQASTPVYMVKPAVRHVVQVLLHYQKLFNFGF